MSNDTITPNEFKWCPKCRVWKSTLEFSPDRSHKDGLHSHCKICRAEERRLWRIEHPGAENPSRRRRYAEKGENSAWRMRNKDKVREYHRRNHHKYPEKQLERKRRRLSRKVNLPFSFSAKDEAQAIKYFHGRCAVCGRPLNDLFGEHKVAMDHWIPLSDPRPDNPGTVPTNMIPLCHGIDGCNNKKHNCDPIEWLTREFNPRKAKQIAKRIRDYFDWVRSQ